MLSHQISDERWAVGRLTSSVFLALSMMMATLSCSSLQAEESTQLDGWLTNAPAAVPGLATPAMLNTNLFASLHAERLDERHLGIAWTPEVMDTNAQVSLLVSFGAPGHWPSRDWQPYPMANSGTNFVARPPVDDLDVPLVYAVCEITAAATNYSPLRVCLPEALGLAAPSRLFPAFIEGFEQGAEHWRLLAQQPIMPDTFGEGHSGYRSLAVALPAERHTVGVATTQVRGWQLTRHEITGLVIWLRTTAGEGTARFTLVANTGTTEETPIPSNKTFTLTPRWQKVVIPLDSFRELPLGEVDQFRIEFSALRPTQFLVDDLQFIGPWKTEPD